jgi:Flp pilus assembly pilin Flp
VTVAVLASVSQLRGWLPSAHRDERGQDTLEWIMMSGLIAIAIVAVIGLFNGAVTAGFTQLRDCVDLSAATTCGPTAF